MRPSLTEDEVKQAGNMVVQNAVVDGSSLDVIQGFLRISAVNVLCLHRHGELFAIGNGSEGESRWFSRLLAREIAIAGGEVRSELLVGYVSCV